MKPRIKKFAPLVCLLLTLAFASNAYSFQYHDDFNTLNRDFWLIFPTGGHDRVGPFPPRYDLGILSNGTLSLPVEETDNGPELITKPIAITPDSVITVSWRARVHYGNEYFAGSVYFLLVNYPSMYPSSDYSIPPFQYLDPSTNQYKTATIAGVYYRNYVYNNYPPPRGGNSFGICGYEECLVSPPIWDQWFTNKVEINFPEKKVRFWQNSQLIGEVPMNPSLDPATLPYIRIWFSPYGWWTGHKMDLDWFDISVSSEASSPSEPVQDCQSCTSYYDAATGTIHIPAVKVNGEYYSVELNLSSLIPSVTFTLGSVTPGQCPVGCESCAASFNPETNTLNIPSIKVDSSYYSVTLKLSSILPNISFSLLSVDQGISCEGTSDSQNPCTDCSCPDYALSHPQECGKTGKLNFRIIWHNGNDVDLHVVYQGALGNEEIYHSYTPGSITGGNLDVDANAMCVNDINTVSPTENIYFENPPSGTYTVLVCGYELCDEAHPNTTVTVQVLKDGQIIWEKEVVISNWNDDCQQVYQYTIP